MGASGLLWRVFVSVSERAGGFGEIEGGGGAGGGDLEGMDVGGAVFLDGQLVATWEAAPAGNAVWAGGEGGGGPPTLADPFFPGFAPAFDGPVFVP